MGRLSRSGWGVDYIWLSGKSPTKCFFIRDDTNKVDPLAHQQQRQGERRKNEQCEKSGDGYAS